MTDESVNEDHRMKTYISLDIGGTAIKYGLISDSAEIIFKGSTKTEAEKGGPEILKKVIGIVEDLLTRTQNKVSGICISTAGMVDTKEGSIFYASPLIPNYAGIQYKKILEERFHIPCEVENDVNCAGLAEYSSGAAKGSRIALILTVGTGIGGCIVIDGKVFRGFGNSACEVGYMHMGDSDFQTLGAASTLTKKVAQWKGEPQEKWDGRHVFEEAGRGDRLCIRAIDEMTDVLGRGIANICYVIDPEVVVLGGGIMAQEDFLKGKIENALKKYLVPGMAEHTRIAFARHRNDAGMLGAFYHFCSLRRAV